MKRDTWSVFTVAAAVVFLTVFAQGALADSHEEAVSPEAPPAYSVIHYDNVAPAMADEYEANSKAWVEAFKKAGLGEEYAWRMYAGPNFSYAFVTDMPNYGYLDKGEEQQKMVADALGEEMMGELVAGIAGESHYSEVVKRDPDLTYIPEGGMGEVGFVRLARHNVKPGMEDKFKEAVKKAMAARKKSGSTMPTLTSQIQFGHGSYMMVTIAKDAATFYSAPSMGAILAEAYGAEGAQELYNDWRDCISDYETSDWQFRPDLSYMPGMYEEDEAMEGSSE